MFRLCFVTAPKHFSCVKWRLFHQNPRLTDIRNPMQGFYEMPEPYRNSFYLANASYFDCSNWFIHYAYEIVFETLAQELKSREPTYNDDKAFQTIKELIRSIEYCDELLDVNITTKNADNTLQTVRGYRAHHGVNVLNRPCLGGLRLQKSVKKDHCLTLALLSTYRNACAGINLAGAHGGIKINPHEMTEKDIKEVLKKYASELTEHNFCGPTIDVMEPDLNCGSKELEYIANNPEADETIVAVKEKSALSNYYTTISYGMLTVIDHYINNKKVYERIGFEKGLKGKTFIIQGIGKTGAEIAVNLEKAGAKCVGVKERDAYLYVKEGISVEAIVNHKINTGSIINFSEHVKPYKVYDIFKEECDILVLAATHKSLQCYIADKIKATVIIEVANGAITPAAYKSLIGRNKLVIPDILLNAGCSVTSYFEYLKGMEGLPFGEIVKKYASKLVQDALRTSETEQEVIQKSMNCIIMNTIKEVYTHAERYKLDFDLKTSAYINAINKIFNLIFNAKKY